MRYKQRYNQRLFDLREALHLMVHLCRLTNRRDFIDRLNHFVHPGEEISSPEQLKVRDQPMLLLRDAFETNGLNAFVWGLRGVGKTSLVHTSCNKFDDTVQLATAVACQRHSTHNELLDDLVRRLVSYGRVNVKDSSVKASLSAFGITVEGKGKTIRDHIEIRSVDHGSDLLGTIMPEDYAKRREWVVIIDEFDQLENIETIEFFTALAKQISVDKRAVKFVFCGVASNLNDLIGTHESVERYIKAISLDPLSADHIIDITRFIAQNFEVRLSRGQEIRIAQIACGYPHFAHVIMKEILSVAYEEGFSGEEITPDIFRQGVHKAASGAAIRLQNAYEAATKKGTDRYIEVLWAVATGRHLSKQFKNIRDDYSTIMEQMRDREPIQNEQTLRNHLNALCGDRHGSVLQRAKAGWYQFADPMLRSYVRMMAHNSGVNIGEESFRD